jgi:hypothetical protein
MTKKPESPAETTPPQSDDRVQVVNKSKRYISIPIAKGVKKTIGTELDAHMVDEETGKGHPHKVRLTQAEYAYAMSKKGVQGLFESGELQSIARA